MGSLRVFRQGVDILLSEGLLTFLNASHDYVRHRVQWTKYLIHRMIWRVKYGEAAPSATSLIHVDPGTIKRMVTGHRPFTAKWTSIIGGEWDRRKFEEEFASERNLRSRVKGGGVAKLDQYTFFRSMEAHFHNDVPWEMTEFYQYKKESEEGGYYGTEKKRRRRCDEISRLYANMREEGYKSQRELQDVASPNIPLASEWNSPPELNEVAVAISRDGEILLVDGRHRLSVAQLIGIDEIPVRVVARHTEWQEYRQRVASASDPERAIDDLNLPEDHPDLRQFIE